MRPLTKTRRWRWPHMKSRFKRFATTGVSASMEVARDCPVLTSAYWSPVATCWNGRTRWCNCEWYQRQSKQIDTGFSGNLLSDPSSLLSLDSFTIPLVTPTPAKIAQVLEYQQEIIESSDNWAGWCARTLPLAMLIYHSMPISTNNCDRLGKISLLVVPYWV